jgi:hypothetical protein
MKQNEAQCARSFEHTASQVDSMILRSHPQAVRLSSSWLGKKWERSSPPGGRLNTYHTFPGV